MVQLCMMKLASNAEAPPILGKVKQKIIDIGAVTHVFLLFGTYICDGRWDCAACIVMPGSLCEGFGNGVGRGVNLSECLFIYISWLEIMRSKSEMIKSRFAISNSSHENVLYRLSGCLSMMTEQSLIKTTLHRLREVSTARFVPNWRGWGEITETNVVCILFISSIMCL